MSDDDSIVVFLWCRLAGSKYPVFFYIDLILCKYRYILFTKIDILFITEDLVRY